LIALIEEAAVIGRISGISACRPTPAPVPAHAPPAPAGASNQAGWDDDTWVFNSCS
jgi:hypothetical protein